MELSTTEVSKTSDPTNSHRSPNVIFSLESGDGLTPSGWPDGPTMCRCGQVPVHASLSPRQAKERDLMTSGTCGPRSSGTSNSAALTCALENRLRAKTAERGSTLYRMTWKAKITPSGRRLPWLVASAHRTNGSGFIGWLAPSARTNCEHRAAGQKELTREHAGGTPSLMAQVSLIKDTGSNAKTDTDQLSPAHVR